MPCKYSPIRGIITCLTVMLACTLSAAAEGQRGKAPGIALGETAPQFKLKDQNGKEHSLKALVESGKKVAVVFHRSAEW